MPFSVDLFFLTKVRMWESSLTVKKLRELGLACCTVLGAVDEVLGLGVALGVGLLTEGLGVCLGVLGLLPAI